MFSGSAVAFCGSLDVDCHHHKAGGAACCLDFWLGTYDYWGGSDCNSCRVGCGCTIGGSGFALGTAEFVLEGVQRDPVGLLYHQIYDRYL